MNEICLSCRKHTKCDRAIHETIGCGYYVPQTNEEWFCQLSTEEKAKVLNDLYWGFGYKAKLYYNLEPTKESFEKWLKQPHKESDAE